MFLQDWSCVIGWQRLVWYTIEEKLWNMEEHFWLDEWLLMLRMNTISMICHTFIVFSMMRKLSWRAYQKILDVCCYRWIAQSENVFLFTESVWSRCLSPFSVRNQIFMVLCRMKTMGLFLSSYIFCPNVLLKGVWWRCVKREITLMNVEINLYINVLFCIPLCMFSWYWMICCYGKS